MYHEITLSGLEPAYYRIRIIAEGEPGDRKVFRRSFTIPKKPLDCSPYLLDQGISSNGDKVIFTFASTGLYSSFICQLNRDQPVPCKLTVILFSQTRSFGGISLHVATNCSRLLWSKGHFGSRVFVLHSEGVL